jgi:hypothetical protein
VGLDNPIDVATFGSDVRVRQCVLVFGYQSFTFGCWVCSLGELLAEQHVDRTLCPHHGDFGGRPSKVEVGAEVLGSHHVVGTAVGLAGDDRDEWHRCLGIGVDQLRAATNNAVPLLVCAGQETWNVDKGQDRDIEGIAGADEPRGLL